MAKLKWITKGDVFGLTWLLVLGAIWGVYALINSKTDSISQNDAIVAVAEKYPAFADYPSTDLPPKSIITKKTEQGWYIAFVQEGSGRPIISASCFFVDNQKIISKEKTYYPVFGEDLTATLSPVTCSPTPET